MPSSVNSTLLNSFTSSIFKSKWLTTLLFSSVAVFEYLRIPVQILLQIDFIFPLYYNKGIGLTLFETVYIGNLYMNFIVG